MGGEREVNAEEAQDWKSMIHRCFRCGYCKFTKSYSDLNCPSYKKYRFETFSTGGRLWLAYAALNGDLPWSANLANVLYACTTCGNCVENCQFDRFNDFIVDFIEAARAEAVAKGFCPEKQKALDERTLNPDFHNPYAEPNSTNEELKEKYNLPDEAEWVYFIGCTSNYRQKELRDSTLRFLKKAKIDFTLIDEHCCCSPLIRTGQTKSVKGIIDYNIFKIRNTGATKIITSCAGCYRTIKQDWAKQGNDHGFQVFHTVELIKQLLDEKKIQFQGEYNKTVTYHDPCHIGRHVGLYDIPREVYKAIPGLTLVEMKRNRENAWCCGAGGGVKIGYPDWALEISEERVIEAKETGASVLSSTCPFCRTNLSDANNKFNMEFEVIDLIEIIDKIDFKVNAP